MELTQTAQKKKIEYWKKRLIDLSKRNNLISYRFTKSKSLKVDVPSFKEAYNDLINEGVIKILTTNKKERVPFEWVFTEDEETITKKLYKLYLVAKNNFEELGINTCFFSLGAFKYKDSDNSDIYRQAPIFLFSSEIERENNAKKGYHRFKIISDTGELQLNVALAEKLHKEYNIKIPSFNKNEDPQKYISKLKDLTSGIKGSSVSEEIYFDIFSYEKYIMYKDLINNENILKDSNLVQAYMGDRDILQDEISETIRDEVFDDSQTPDLLPADSSQKRAIELAKAGVSFVLQGPPGTGKSQTIVNIIGELINQNKKILFVSQKMAALNVVNKRLKEIGLSRYCLNLHKYRGNKREIIEQLVYELENSPKIRNDSLEYDYESYLNIQKELNNYYSFLCEKRSPWEKSLYEIKGILAKLNFINEEELCEMSLNETINLPKKEYNKQIQKLERIGEIFKKVNNPFGGALFYYKNDKNTVVHRKKFLELFSNSEKYLKNLILSISEVGRVVNKKFCTTNELDLLIDIEKELRIVSDVNPYFISTEFEERLKIFQKLYNIRERINILEENIKKEVNIDFLKDSTIKQEKIFRKNGIISRIYNKEYSITKKTMEKYLKGKKKNHKFWMGLFKDKNEINSLNKSLKKLYSSKSLNKSLGQSVSLKKLKKIKKDITSIKKAYEKSQILSPTKSHKILEVMYRRKPKLEENKNNINKIFMDLNKYLNKNYFFLEENLENFSTELNKINDTFVNLNDILLVREEYEALNDEIKKIVIKYSGLEKKDRLMDTFKKLYWSKVLENILKKGNIIPPKDLVEKYRLNAFEVSDNWRFKIMGAANMKKPSLAITSSGSSEVSILRREGKKKRRLKPIRDLLSETSDLSFSLKPCFMMSPLSVSQYIDPNKIKFDVVIFDEASQIMPQDAVPCLMRSKQAIIMGDTQQLPPTTFFSSQDEEEVEEEIEDLESFLSEASIKFREKSLDWHYRSNDESLIAFSNHFFYDGRLITFPNSSNSNGLEHIYVKEGVYDRGKSRKNRKEAKAIVESYVSLKKKYPTKSFGIIAFSIAQENAIREEFQLKKIDLDASIGSEKEDLFVKNLETVQGDERDIIIISVGYGKSSDGKLSYNFGPINKEGGFKRLNVAITRSRFKTLIFSSILPTMLDEDKINSQGLRNLKQYMTYARKKNIGGLISSTEHLNFDSGFEESVYDSLINEGYDVSCQVGCSGYKVDLAIKHPKNKGEYILGVECDGAQYHSSRYARDRDKVRQDVLERLGWKIHRIWSDDWLNNREHELEKIKNKINSLLKSKKKFEKKQDNQFLDADEEHLEEKEIEDLFESYEFADIPTRRRKLEYDSYGDLYDEEYIKRLIREVLSIEEPIEKSLLYKRVANSFGIRKVGARIKRNFDGLINEMGIQKNGETLSWKRITGIFPPRISNEEVRPFIYIPKEELAGALIEILKNNFSTDRKSIMKDVTKIYNINRLGNKVHKKVEEAIKYLKRKKLIEEFDGKIRKTKEK